MRAWFATLNVKSKLRVIHLAATGAGMLLAMVILLSYLWETEQSERLREAEITAQVMAQNSAAAFLFDDSRAAAELMGSLKRSEDILGADLLRVEGGRLASYRRAGDAGERWGTADFDDLPGVERRSHFHFRHLDVAVPVEADGRVLGGFQMRVDLSGSHRRVLAFATILVLASLAATLLAMVLLDRMQRGIVGPLGRLLDTMRRVSRSGDYSQRAEISTRDEIGALGEGFNRMIGQIEERDEALGRELNERRRTEEMLRRSEARYRSLFADSRLVILVINPGDGRILDANAAACAYYGHDIATFRAMNIAEVNVAERPRIREAMARAALGSQSQFDFRHRMASGEIRDVRVSSGPVDLDGQTVLLSVVEDVTEKRRAEQRMRQALVVFNASSQGIVTTDAEGLVTAVNPAFTEITGYGAPEVVGRKLAMFRADRQDSGFNQTLWGELLSTGGWQGEIWSRRKNGEEYPQWLTITAVRDQDGPVLEYVSMFSDITERKRQEHEIWRQANFDALTGLANRNLFHERLDRAIVQAKRSGRKLALMFLDLDGFKWVNDTLGHDQGDRLLVEVAGRLKACVREQDTVARLGGDEFTLVIQDLTHVPDLVAVAEKVVEVVREPFRLGGGTQHVSASVGITVYPDDGADVQTLLKHADIAMYNSKQGGKNRFQFYAHHMQTDAQARVRTEAELHVALREGGLVLHYQPVIDVAGGGIVGAEALVRWQHPLRGLVYPAEFIPLAEDCGLITAIGDWVLREAARQSRQWRQAGMPALRLAVNCSAVQFRQPELPRTVAEVLELFQVEPGALTLEITESVLMDSSGGIDERMHAIRDLGVGYALDDFGTGFSSLSYLKRFPIDELKIDRSFVNDCTEDVGNAHLVEAIINMAHGLGMQVTAEGVESRAQLAFLRERGCDHAQGYLFSKPVPPKEFEALVRDHGLAPRRPAAVG